MNPTKSIKGLISSLNVKYSVEGRCVTTQVVVWCTDSNMTSPISTTLFPLHTCRFLGSTESWNTVASKEWRRVENTEGGGGIGDEPKGDELPTEMEDILDEIYLNREGRATAGGCKSPPEQDAYKHSREGNLRARVQSIRKSEDWREESEASGEDWRDFASNDCTWYKDNWTGIFCIKGKILLTVSESKISETKFPPKECE